jgi:hypothetical protein
MEPYPPAVPPPEQARPQPPGPVRLATYFMYGGAVLSLLNGLLVALTIASYRTAIRRAFPRYTDTRVHEAAAAGVTISVVLALVEICLWLGLAWACRAGKGWGRMTGTVLFVLNTVLLAVPLLVRANSGVPAHVTIGTLLTVLIWLAGLGAVVMLWRRESSAYFTA